jgi:hypothetical protein
MRELPKDLGGYQCMENGVVKFDDILVCAGRIIGFVSHYDIGNTITPPTHSGSHYNVYRKMPVRHSHGEHFHNETHPTP